VLKDGYVSESTSLHMFARRMLDSLQHADHMDAGEAHYAQVKEKQKKNHMAFAMVTVPQLQHSPYSNCKKRQTY